MASIDFQPKFGAEPALVELAQFLGSTQANANFPIGNGLGAAVTVENVSGAPIDFPDAAAWVALDVHRIELVFNPRPPDLSVVD